MKPGDVVLVKFPFNDLETTKKRPALVLSVSEVSEKISLITVVMITSKIDGIKFPGDYKIEKWKQVGLIFPSLIRFAKITSIEKELISKTLGKLDSMDLRGAKLAFKKQFKGWVS